jgi:hypothetical protein
MINNKFVIMLMMVFILILSGFLFLYPEDKNKFVGTWELIESDPPSVIDPENQSYFETYFYNGSYLLEIRNKKTNELLSSHWEKYKIEYGKLYKSIDGDVYSLPINYRFSNNDNRVTFEKNSEYFIVFTKR